MSFINNHFSFRKDLPKFGKTYMSVRCASTSFGQVNDISRFRTEGLPHRETLLLRRALTKKDSLEMVCRGSSINPHLNA